MNSEHAAAQFDAGPGPPLTPAAQLITVLLALGVLLCLPLLAVIGLLLQLAFAATAPVLVLVALFGRAPRCSNPAALGR